MIHLELGEARIFVRPGATDMRKQINGLVLLVQEEMETSPFATALFVFCNAQRRLLKAVYWDRTGFCLWMKRLDACHHCEGSGDEDRPAVRVAPAPPALIPKGLASEGLLAYIATAKFCDALPLYRQERQFARLGVYQGGVTDVAERPAEFDRAAT